jgi:hypothetical protein
MEMGMKSIAPILALIPIGLVLIFSLFILSPIIYTQAKRNIIATVKLNYQFSFEDLSLLIPLKNRNRTLFFLASPVCLGTTAYLPPDKCMTPKGKTLPLKVTETWFMTVNRPDIYELFSERNLAGFSSHYYSPTSYLYNCIPPEELAEAEDGLVKITLLRDDELILPIQSTDVEKLFAEKIRLSTLSNFTLKNETTTIAKFGEVKNPKQSTQLIVLPVKKIVCDKRGDCNCSNCFEKITLEVESK